MFGILTGGDITLGEGMPPEVYASMKEARQGIEKMKGAMFKFRTRLDGERLSLSDVRASVFDLATGAGGPAKADSSWPGDQYFSGRFERVIGKLPPPKPMPGLLINRYVEDPNIRLEQLQKQADDLKQINEEREKFWSNDMPHHLSMPKGKEIAPPAKLPPAGNKPVPMSSGKRS